jgi:hypothetical protein
MRRPFDSIFTIQTRADAGDRATCLSVIPLQAACACLMRVNVEARRLMCVESGNDAGHESRTRSRATRRSRFSPSPSGAASDVQSFIERTIPDRPSSSQQLNDHNDTMFPQRTMLRTSQRFASQLRSPAVRTPFQRRFASTESSGFVGAEDNAFNRERKAVKDHAAATSGA